MIVFTSFVFRWSYLEVYTNEKFDDLKQAYAAGIVEGILTKDLIDLHWYNTYDGYCAKPLSTYCKKVQKYVDANMNWVTKQLMKYADSDSYWHQVC